MKILNTILMLTTFAANAPASDLTQIDLLAFDVEREAYISRIPNGPIVQLVFSKRSDQVAVAALRKVCAAWYFQDRGSFSNVVCDGKLSMIVAFDDKAATQVASRYIPPSFEVTLKDWSIALPFNVMIIDQSDADTFGGSLVLTDSNVAFGRILDPTELRRFIHVDSEKVRKVEEKIGRLREGGVIFQMIATEDLLDSISEKKAAQPGATDNPGDAQ